MKKISTIFFLIIILLIFDNSLIPFIGIKGICPSLLFVFIVCYSIINDSWEGLWIGVIAGVLQDIYFANVFGVNALINMIICVIAGQIGVNILKEKSFIPIMSCFVLSILKGVLMLVIMYILKLQVQFKVIFFNSVFNMFISIFIYKMVYKLCSKEYMQRKWKF